jgi:hypothetical protein
MYHILLLTNPAPHTTKLISKTRTLSPSIGNRMEDSVLVSKSHGYIFPPSICLFIIPRSIVSVHTLGPRMGFGIVSLVDPI